MIPTKAKSRRILKIAAIIGLLNPFLFIAIAAYLGGAVGLNSIVEGRYYLLSSEERIEVEPWVWYCSLLHLISVFVLILVPGALGFFFRWYFDGDIAKR